MTITVKLPKKRSYSSPNMCVCCGDYCAINLSLAPSNFNNLIFVNSVELLSRSTILFYVCDKCNKYRQAGGGRNLTKRERELLPPAEKNRAEGTIGPVYFSNPFLYLGKVTFTFKNNSYGRAFWELNGGEIIEKRTK